MLMTQLVVHRFEVIEVDQEQRQRRGGAVGPRKRDIEAAPQLAYVGEPGEAVRDRFEAAPVVAQGICERHRGAAGQSVNGEQVLVAELRV